MAVMDLSETIHAIQGKLIEQNIALMRRAYVKGEQGSLIPTGEVRYQIKDQPALKRLLVASVGTQRAIEIGQKVSVCEDGLKVHRMIELLQTHELLAMHEILVSNDRSRI